jgi:hypothetical protein
MGASRLECAEPHGGSPGQENFFMACWTLCWGPTWDWQAQHGAANGQPKVNGGHTTGACGAPRAVHRDRWLHWACYFNRGPTWTPSGPPACQNHTGFGVAVLNCLQEIKNIPFWTAPSGLSVQHATVLAALSALQQRPHVPLSDIVNMDLYVWYILKYTCQVAVCEAESSVSKYMLWLSSQDFLKGSRARRR